MPMITPSDYEQVQPAVTAAVYDGKIQFPISNLSTKE